MPPGARLKVGDTISVKGIDAFNLDWLKEHYPREWPHKRFSGTVAAHALASKWKIAFEDGEELTLDRSKIRLEARTPPNTQLAQEVESSGDEAVGGEAAAEVPDNDCSSDEPDSDGEGDALPRARYEADHGEDETLYDQVQDDQWVRDDGFNLDQRAKAQFDNFNGPGLRNFTNFEDAGPFKFALHFLPTMFLVALAARMTAAGKRKHEAGDRKYANWNVSVDDVYQWIDVWMYMLAFPQAGDRTNYWTEPPGGFGPRHRLADWLRLGGNGEKSGWWFRQMVACFEMPPKPGTSATNDPFYPVRYFWESLREAFFGAVSCSWLMVLDESMVRWEGRGMPGLMVLLRKPTPIGLELHTLCCALCGVLLWFEVYEGKTAMESQKWCPTSTGAGPKYPKSVALTLRMTEKWHGHGKVLIADSWFGSVNCALALWLHGVFAIMNVKTATKKFPKNEMMQHVAEVKGKTADAQQRRRARRGATIAFTQTVKMGQKSVTLLAAGQN